jgi:hypothetical protein
VIQCDRASPCSNCVARKKEAVCRYENESARKQQLLEEGTPESRNGNGNATSPVGMGAASSRLEADSTTHVSALGYAKGENRSTTMDIYKRIEGYGTGASSGLASQALTSIDNGLRESLKEKYKTFIRQLPAKEYIEKLVAAYFREVNYQYYPLDEDMFRENLNRWYDLSISTLNEGPLGLSADLRFFPALLFQMLALALQYQPPDHDPALHCLKYAACMSLDDLAGDYSDSGISISTLLGKRHTSLVAVQAGFLRTTYLKNCGMIPESWHSLSQTIRDAQEIGLHKKFFERGTIISAEDSLDHLWQEQFRRRMWGVLTLWDIHMAIILGRPATVDSRYSKLVMPIDTPTPRNRRAMAPTPRTSDEPPTPLTSLIWSFELSEFLWEIYNLEKEDPTQSHIPQLEKLEQQIRDMARKCPPCLRAENPDTRFDSHPSCAWIPGFRAKVRTEIAFAIMALHRPYIFTNSSSRTTAVTSSIDILQAQRELFTLLDVRQYKMFSLVINTFDAVVVLAAIYIMHPNENRDLLNPALQHFEWGIQRFHRLSERNSMAKSALGVLKAIHSRLKKAVSTGRTPYLPPNCLPASRRSSTQQTPSASSDISAPMPTPSGTFSSRSGSSQRNIGLSQPPTPNGYGPSALSPAITSATQYTQPTISNLTSPTPPPDPAWERFSGSTTLPVMPTFDFSSIAPLQPVHDLIYNDLTTIADPQLIDPQLRGLDASDGSAGIDDTSSWQFDGAFSEDSFWGLMNYYTA